VVGASHSPSLAVSAIAASCDENSLAIHLPNDLVRSVLFDRGAVLGGPRSHHDVLTNWRSAVEAIHDSVDRHPLPGLVEAIKVATPPMASVHFLLGWSISSARVIKPAVVDRFEDSRRDRTPITVLVRELLHDP
jgi:hypothetical protein